MDKTLLIPHRAHDKTDVVVAGAGTVGLATAIALAREGLSVVCVGPSAKRLTGRTVALLEGSVHFLAALGVWDDVRPRAAPMRAMRIIDDTPSLFKGPPVVFAAREIGLAEFGFNIENDVLTGALGEAAARTPGLVRIDAEVASAQASARETLVALGTGETIAARLAIAADGARSPLRTAAGIAVRRDLYPQAALTTILRHGRSHGDISTEFHTREGPFTLVPMRDDEEGRPRSSLVWVMAPGEAERCLALSRSALAADIERRSRGLLGRIEITGGLGHFPIRRAMAERLFGARLALAGEAAHALPPIGAQGLNLSLRDAATLADAVAGAHRLDQDIGGDPLLKRYEADRLGDIVLRGAFVHGLNMALLSPGLPIDVLRGTGLKALGRLPALRDAVMRQGLSPRHGEPRLMRERVGDA